MTPFLFKIGSGKETHERLLCPSERGSDPGSSHASQVFEPPLLQEGDGGTVGRSTRRHADKLPVPLNGKMAYEFQSRRNVEQNLPSPNNQPTLNIQKLCVYLQKAWGSTYAEELVPRIIQTDHLQMQERYTIERSYSSRTGKSKLCPGITEPSFPKCPKC